MSSLKISILGGGSKGNSILIDSKNSAILIDAGFSRKELVKRLEILNTKPEKIEAILVTHEHHDHIAGIKVFSKQFSTPIYLTGETNRFLLNKKKIENNANIFAPGNKFSILDFEINPFSIQHDALEPVGFVINYGQIKIGIATDLGKINKLVEHKLKDCDCLILESNYDIDMLRNSDRHLSLKQRIIGTNGHLSNEDAISSFEKLLTKKTKYLFLTHLSSDCNSKEIVLELAKNELNKLNRNDIILNIAEQNKPTELIELNYE